jgi:hypothetical protein
MGLVMSLAKPHRAKHEVTRIKGTRKLTPSFERMGSSVFGFGL